MTKVQIKMKQLHKDAHDTKEIHFDLSQQLFNCDDVKGNFDK